MSLFGYQHSMVKHLIRFGFHPGKGWENVAVAHLSPLVRKSFGRNLSSRLA